MIHSLLVSSLLLGSSLTVRGRNPLAVSLCPNKTVSHPSENRLILGIGKYSLNTFLVSTSLILSLILSIVSLSGYIYLSIGDIYNPWEAPASGSCSGQCKFQCPKEFVIECSGTLGCEQCHILNDFLSVDCGQLLSVWFCLNLILPLRSSAFYTI